MRGDPDDWRTFAALGVIGKADEGLTGLSRFDEPEVRFYEGVVHWISGDEAQAASLLERVNTPYARRLLALIRKPQIRILALMDRGGFYDILTAAGQDSKFLLNNIGFQPGDLPNHASANVYEFYDSQSPPDFFFCKPAENQLIPPNIQEVPCRTIAQTAIDYDAHLQTVYPWLQAFDQLVVSGSGEWRDAGDLFGRPVASFPKTCGLPDNLPPLPSADRDIDLFMSGQLLHPYHPEKTSCLAQVLRIPNINLVVVGGYVEPTAYFALLGRTKVSYTVVRDVGSSATPGRCLEALSMGCGVVVQKDSNLALFAGEEEGVLTYDLGAGDLAPAVQQILRQWLEFESRARRGAGIVRSHFGLRRVASEYFRFLTFLAARPRLSRRAPKMPLDQKRVILWRGMSAPATVYDAIAKSSLDRGQERFQSQPSAQTIIDTARERVLRLADDEWQHRAAGNIEPAPSQTLSACLDLYWVGVRLFPGSLPLRFNLVRVALHFGDPGDVAQAQQLARETLKLPPSSWQVDPMEDVFPWDFLPDFFNYRKYCHLVRACLKGQSRARLALADVILASMSFYLSHYDQALDHVREAVKRDPDFPFYKIHYAQQLLRCGRPEDYSEAGAILNELANGSILFADALEMLDQLAAQRGWAATKSGERVQHLRWGKAAQNDPGVFPLRLLSLPSALAQEAPQRSS